MPVAPKAEGLCLSTPFTIRPFFDHHNEVSSRLEFGLNANDLSIDHFEYLRDDDQLSHTAISEGNTFAIGGENFERLSAAWTETGTEVLNRFMTQLSPIAPNPPGTVI